MRLHVDLHAVVVADARPPHPEDEGRLEQQPHIEHHLRNIRSRWWNGVYGYVNVRGKHRNEQRHEAKPREPPRPRHKDAEAADDLCHAADSDERPMPRQPRRHHREVEVRGDKVVHASRDEERGEEPAGDQDQAGAHSNSMAHCDAARV